MIINTEDIEKLLQSETTYRIAEDIGGTSRQNLDNYKHGRYNIDKMTIGLASKLQNYYKKVEYEMKIKEVRKQLEDQEKGYYIEDYENIAEMLDERGWDKAELLDRVDEVGFEIKEDVPVVTYDNPNTDLFNVAFVTEDMTTEDILNELE